MGGLKKRGPKHKKQTIRNKVVPSFESEFTREELEFKRMMEEGNIYIKVHGVNRQVR